MLQLSTTVHDAFNINTMQNNEWLHVSWPEPQSRQYMDASGLVALIAYSVAT